VPAPGRSFPERMIHAALLDIETYEDIEADESATLQAAGVVAMVALCGAIGAWNIGPVGALSSALSAIGGWLAWSGITYVVGDKIFGATATWGEVLRTLGFAQSPGVLLVLGIVPVLGVGVSLVVAIWVLIAGFIGIRQALDISNGKTFLTIIVGGLIYGALQAIF